MTETVNQSPAVKMAVHKNHIHEKIAALPADASYFSLEFFPPKTAQGFTNLHARLARMARALRPLFVSVTWGAGGSTAGRSLELAELCQASLGLTTCLHLTCTNMSPDLVDQALDRAKAIGIRNILALRGDAPDNSSPAQSPTDQTDKPTFTYASDLVRHIRARHGSYFSIGVAAYPEGHADEAYPLAQDVDRDLPHLVEKVKAGADFILTQLFFDPNSFISFEHRLRNHPSGVFASIPIVPGLMPVQSYKILVRTAKLSHARLPPALVARVEPVKEDDEAVKGAGVSFFENTIRQIQAENKTCFPRGFHFYTLNLEKVVSHLIERCGLIAPATPECDAEAEDSVAIELGAALADSSSADRARRRRLSSMNANPHNRVIVAASASRPLISLEASQDEAGVPSDGAGTRATALAISEGEGSLGREATWDDFPNGRWGDSRSPAFGEIDGYGVSLPVPPTEAIKLWGSPSTESDISALFSAHISGSLSALPWSDDGQTALSAETSLIQPHLEFLNSAGWWTVASQPAVDAARSHDPVVGWGPRNGVVFQKAFVELFIPLTDWPVLKAKLDEEYQAAERVSYLASGVPTSGSVQSSPDQAGGDGGNPVTWGVFPGKEIVTPTIIQPTSFSAWLADAFDLWAAWERIYRSGSPSARLIERMRRDRMLVCIVHHEYPNTTALWDLLREVKQSI